MIVVDSGSIISLAMNCLCPVLGMMGRKFIITPQVYKELIERPSEGRRFALESMRIGNLVTSGVVRITPPSTNLGCEILDAANKIYKIGGRPVRIIHEAEAEVIAVAGEVGAKAACIDERTMRLLVEDPESLRSLLERRNKQKVSVNRKWLRRIQEMLPKIPIIRSSEIVAVAYERGYLTQLYGIDDKKLLEASLSALKYSGCSISWEEIDEYLRLEI
jgi:predicted nucleic acid-binding protein